jgi:tRNA (cmo5U34)-methyltransferase
MLESWKDALKIGGAIIVFDKAEPLGGYAGTILSRLTLAAKYEAGATPDEIIRKELSLAGVQRPLSRNELDGFDEIFRFGDFAGWLYIKR